MVEWATHFYEIPNALANNDIVRNTAVNLVETEPINAGSLEGGDREAIFRGILGEFLAVEIGFEDAKRRVKRELPDHQSPHAGTQAVFPPQWVDTVARRACSRFYNQAVLLTLKKRGEDTCFVPRSPFQDPRNKCTRELCGREVSVGELLEGLERAYRQQQWSAFPRIPYKPNCTHTVTPVE